MLWLRQYVGMYTVLISSSPILNIYSLYDFELNIVIIPLRIINQYFIYFC